MAGIAFPRFAATAGRWSGSSRFLLFDLADGQVARLLGNTYRRGGGVTVGGAGVPGHRT